MEKKAYVFYDDSWIGVEPYSKRFKEFGFDGWSSAYLMALRHVFAQV